MNVLLLHLDGKLPNLALMRLAAHHRALGHRVELRHAGNPQAVNPRLGDPAWGAVYGSLIFESTRKVAERARIVYPDIVLGGTGWDLTATLEDRGIGTALDYADYPAWRQSIGFTQRGCRLKCEFCVVPRKEGKARANATVAEVWRGSPWPREVILLDNDFFGGPHWPDRIEELRAGEFKVCFSQGINARMLNAETAAAIASVDYRDNKMKERRIYTAWDNRDDERTLFRGLRCLVDAGVKPREIMVYMLIGFWAGETHADRDYRRQQLRDFGARPYPMPFRRTPELTGFQRWVVGSYDKGIPWVEWSRAHWSPRRLGDRGRSPSLSLFSEAS